jgi:hypothetical protein
VALAKRKLIQWLLTHDFEELAAPRDEPPTLPWARHDDYGARARAS